MATRIPTMYGRYYVISLVWRGRQFTIPVYRAKTALLQRPQAQKIADSMYPGSRVISYHESDATDDPVILVQEHNDGSAKNCKKGEYFCKEDHKCKPIPKGHHVMPDGMLMKGEKHSVKEGAAWTKKSGKNKEGGLNEKGRKSYERDNPGSDSVSYTHLTLPTKA